MRFKLDENISAEAVSLFQEKGHEADTVFSEGLQGENDSVIIKTCFDEQRVLVTLDIDFANIKAYPPEQFEGIIVIRSKDQSKDVVLNLIRSFLPALETEAISKKLWIVESNRLRIREQ